MYQIELVWNREFHFVPYGDTIDNVKEARCRAASLLGMGDGACVKKVRILDLETGEYIPTREN